MHWLPGLRERMCGRGVEQRRVDIGTPRAREHLDAPPSLQAELKRSFPAHTADGCGEAESPRDIHDSATADVRVLFPA